MAHEATLATDTKERDEQKNRGLTSVVRLLVDGARGGLYASRSYALFRITGSLQAPKSRGSLE